ncbi:MAG: LptF/LptG family permease [Pyrinomonadaceae bacterium]|nr:LptF/LptG family permease [Pyrinomonadaceae bacterium]
MISGRRLIPGYTLRAAFPYVILSLFLLTAVLFAQQSGRFAELTLFIEIPFSLLADVSLALLPNVLVFTLPAAVLAGVMIGFARMGSDSEIVAMRAAGVGTWTLLWPVLVIGLLVTVATTYIQMKEAPQATRDLRKAALQGALRKLDSPVEPRNFNTEIPGYVVYVRDGDKAQGSWERVFIYAQQPDGSNRVVTARSGRIDSSGEKSELVLSDAVATKIPGPANVDQRSYVVERLDQLRISIETGRADIIKRINETEMGPEELDWRELRKQASSGQTEEGRAGKRTLHRRLALSVSPFLFALLGGALGMKVRRGGRGVGVLLALLIVIVYYLVSLLGESLARAGTLSPVIGLWAATALMLLISFVLLAANRVPVPAWFFSRFRKAHRPTEAGTTPSTALHTKGVGGFGFPSLLDIGLFRTLGLSFLLAFASLVSVFVIFTLFEMWRFIARNGVGARLVARYVLFLLPLITVELFPATMLIAVLMTYALLARRSETIAWWASGQSVYRLMLPGLFFAVAAGAGTWVVQEHLMPKANLRQDALRARIRGGEPRAITGTGRQWLASAESNRLYSYEFDEQGNSLNGPAIYEFDAAGVHLASMTTGTVGTWVAANRMAITTAETLNFRGLGVERQVAESKEIPAEPLQVFKPTIDKPSQLSAVGLSSYLKTAKRRGKSVSTLAVALQRKYATPFGVVVMAFIGIPLALSFGSKGTIIALCAAVGLSIAYWGVGGGLQQLGNLGLLPPAVAGWSPPIIFAAAGTYLLSRVHT